MRGWIFMLILVVFLTLSGCGDRAGCFESVQAAFPGSEITVVDRGGFRFVVKDKNGAIWYVETISAAGERDASITKKRLLF